MLMKDMQAVMAIVPRSLINVRQYFQGFSAFQRALGDRRERWLLGEFRIFPYDAMLVFRAGKHTSEQTVCTIFCVEQAVSRSDERLSGPTTRAQDTRIKTRIIYMDSRVSAVL